MHSDCYVTTTDSIISTDLSYNYSFFRPDFKFKVPSIVVLRRSDILKPHVVYIGKLEVTEMKDFIIKASIPSMVRIFDL